MVLIRHPFYVCSFRQKIVTWCFDTSNRSGDIHDGGGPGSISAGIRIDGPIRSFGCLPAVVTCLTIHAANILR